jgi:hypothetical protein
MALGDLPDSFDLKELHKGYFPHLLVFNCKENQGAMLSQLPDKQYYQPNGMTPDKRQCFLKWYEEHKNDPFHFQEELLGSVDLMWTYYDSLAYSLDRCS